MAKSKSVNSLDMFGNMAKLNAKPSPLKNNEGNSSPKVKKKYHISFLNENELFFESDIEEGAAVEVPTAIPNKESTEQFNYTFTGWDKPLSPITEDTIFHAEYKSNVRSYEVNFKIDQTIIETQNITYGEFPVAPKTEITKADDAFYHYSFVKWEPSLLTPITDHTDIEAIFSKELIHHTVTFLDGNGNELRKITVAHGEPVAYNFDLPTKSSDSLYNYSFMGWDRADDLESVTEDFTATALYEKRIKETDTFTDEMSEPITELSQSNIIESNSVNSSLSNDIPVRLSASNDTISQESTVMTDTNVPAPAPVKAKVGRPATKKGIAKKVNVLFTDDTMEVINTAKVFFDGNMTKYLETLIMEDYKKNKDLYDTLAKTKRI